MILHNLVSLPIRNLSLFNMLRVVLGWVPTLQLIIASLGRYVSFILGTNDIYSIHFEM
jgi:hypothetical protein